MRKHPKGRRKIVAVNFPSRSLISFPLYIPTLNIINSYISLGHCTTATLLRKLKLWQRFAINCMGVARVRLVLECAIVAGSHSKSLELVFCYLSLKLSLRLASVEWMNVYSFWILISSYHIHSHISSFLFYVKNV